MFIWAIRMDSTSSSRTAMKRILLPVRPEPVEGYERIFKIPISVSVVINYPIFFYILASINNAPDFSGALYWRINNILVARSTQ